jgi:two-component sensor histidine kinase
VLPIQIEPWRGDGREANMLSQTSWLYLGELSHRVVNQYTQAVSSLSLAAAKIPDAAAKAALIAAARTLRDFANVHRTLQVPISNEAIDLTEYLWVICSAIEQARLRDRGIRLSLSGQPTPLEAQRCWWIGLIVSELIENALKHGGMNDSGSIAIEIVASPGEICCHVANNGRGAGHAKAGRGSFIIAGLAQELGGYIDRRSDETGTSAMLRFPTIPTH